MKAMTYNVYKGGEERFSNILEIIKNQNPDLLVIQEACQWQEDNRIEPIRQMLDFPKAQVAHFKANQRSKSGRRYDMVFFSRYPIHSQEVINNKNEIWHTLPHLVIETPGLIHVVLAHLSPFKHWREKEIIHINSLYAKHQHELVVLLGDLNSLSPHDPYPDDLTEQLRQHDINKFGMPPDFAIIKKLEQAGWIDALLKQPTYDGQLHVTVKEASDDKDHLNLRLDYIMGNDRLMKRVRQVEVLASEESEKASDHFPIIANINV